MKNNIFLNLKKKSINNNHFVISIFFETIYQFETEDTLLECFKNITTTGHFGVIGAQYEKIDATRWGRRRAPDRPRPAGASAGPG